jgi:hypothetical protein
MCHQSERVSFRSYGPKRGELPIEAQANRFQELRRNLDESRIFSKDLRYGMLQCQAKFIAFSPCNVARNSGKEFPPVLLKFAEGKFQGNLSTVLVETG